MACLLRFIVVVVCLLRFIVVVVAVLFLFLPAPVLLRLFVVVDSLLLFLPETILMISVQDDVRRGADRGDSLVGCPTFLALVISSGHVVSCHDGVGSLPYL